MHTYNPAETQQEKITLLNWLLLLISGLLIGGGAILPGISGGVLCVVFGIYRPMMELLSHPGSAIPKYWKVFIPVGVGWALGFLGFARIAELMFSASELLATWLFIGLIAGTTPSLFREAGQQGRPKGAYTALGVAFLLMLAVLTAVRFSPATKVSPSFLWYVFAGVLWGLSLIVPGMSSSSILMSLDLYQPLAAGIANLDITVLFPWLLGMAFTIVVLARLVSRLFDKRYAYAFHAVVGVVLASTLAIIPLQYETAMQAVESLLCFAAGFLVAWLLAKLDSRSEAEPSVREHAVKS